MSMTIPPEAVLIQLWLEKAKFTHETVEMDLPPGAEITVEIVPATAGTSQYNFAMTFGDLIDPSILIIHEHPTMMKRHIDPLYYSLVKNIYPLNLRVYKDRPHIVTIKNTGTVMRTVEATIWIIEMGEESMRETQSMLEGLKNLYMGFSKVKVEELAEAISALPIILRSTMKILEKLQRKVDCVLSDLETIKRRLCIDV